MSKRVSNKQSSRFKHSPARSRVRYTKQKDKLYLAQRKMRRLLGNMRMD